MQRRDLIRAGLAAAAAATLPPSAVRAQAARARTGGDLAIVNADIVTLDPGRPRAEAALVRAGRIVRVGDRRSVMAGARDAEVFDAGGRVVTPGFIDGHVHLELSALAFSDMVMAHAPPMTSLAQIKQALAAKARTTPPGRWVVGRSSYDLQNKVTEKRLAMRQELDAITTEHPLILFSGLHVAMLNTAALKALRLWNRAEAENLRWRNGALRVGTTIHRDEAGDPIGIVTEIADLFYSADPYTVDEIKAALRAQTAPLFVDKGITSIAGIPKAVNDIRAIQEMDVAGELPLRIRYYIHTPLTVDIDALMDTGLAAGFGDDMLRFGGVKIFVDGTGGDGLGKSFDDLKWSQEELNRTVWLAHDAGLQCILHCVTRVGFEMAMKAQELAQGRAPRDLRHRIEHVTYIDDAPSIQRMKAMGVRVTLTVAAPASGTRRRGGPRVFRSFVDAGLEPLAVSDSTGTEPDFSPLGGIGALMAGPSEGGVLAEGQALGFETALSSYTLWAARALREDAVKGSIAPGKFGDFAVLSADPRRLRGRGLFDVRAHATILGGRVVHRA
ncbi:amidohydrolase [Phenylobacterium sp.]|jgi:predicted amidohydrolase YtcJ|uniref:amidohydrolase n=1 Tax=Phenylobacterium sp. TaxID=1871053 RepID=UPI003784A4AB